MNLATLIPLALKASIFLNVFSLGLNASLRDLTYLFRNPGRLARSLLSMFIVMPLFAASIASAFDLYPAVEIALVALAVAPMPPLLPKRAMKAGGEPSYAIGLLVAAAVFSILFTPVAVYLLGMSLGAHAGISPLAILRLVLFTILVPLGAGMVVRRFALTLSEKSAKPVAILAMALLFASVIPLLLTTWPAIESLIGNGTLAAIAAFVLAGIIAGHLLGGPTSEDRTVQAISTASRHPGIAMAIANANFPGQKLTGAAILLYLIVIAIALIPYVAWRKRLRLESGGAQAHHNLYRSR
jgi:bile acid:Na+ symporter, BASS family